MYLSEGQPLSALSDYSLCYSVHGHLTMKFASNYEYVTSHPVDVIRAPYCKPRSSIYAVAICLLACCDPSTVRSVAY